MIQQIIRYAIRCAGQDHGTARPSRRFAEFEKVDLDREINLHEALAALKTAAPKDRSSSNCKGNGHDKGDSNKSDWDAVISGILTGTNYHNAIVTFSMKLVQAGTKDSAAVNLIRGLMKLSVGQRDDRWHTRYDDIPRAVSTARAKIDAQQNDRQETDADKPTYLLDPWQRYAAPPFPSNTLPPVLANYVRTQSRVIGCDASALAMATLVSVSGALTTASC